jgi:hypothetical protein
MTQKEASAEAIRFWQWPGNWEQPSHRLSAFLFAALAHQFGVGGRRKVPTRGFMNDVKAISSYGPYLDAMFVDNECATLLEYPNANLNVPLNARIFSLKNSDKLIEYLQEIEDGTPPKVRAIAERIYGLS